MALRRRIRAFQILFTTLVIIVIVQFNRQPEDPASLFTLQNNLLVGLNGDGDGYGDGDHTTIASLSQQSYERQSTNGSKYLQYFVSGGWGNHVTCLASADAIAWATNRTLIL